MRLDAAHASQNGICSPAAHKGRRLRQPAHIAAELSSRGSALILKSSQAYTVLLFDLYLASDDRVPSARV